ncbi:DUF3857 domain-containing protein [Hyunsoonleella sp. SJ7]|uniref:DUF3857 domain-containing protein n=1 Tax=Hyunsoonleella aquatilis TaxID=2762758 RepID=A0A923HE86_9FLAO|nr:DUF3857 domain-containing protein [Hyunsoonleella aquatilis]MBC3759974.1 DUF3857 domain-containing protein [Hyunsoonleella aquatilis]
MLKQILLLLSIACSSILNSQPSEKDPVFRVSLPDIELKSYEKDSTANALVLYEYGKSYVDRQDYDLRTNIMRKIKIFNKEGFDKANVTIYLYKGNNGKYERVDNIFGATYTLVDGKVKTTELDPKDVYREEYNENYTIVKFTLPNIQEGSVITYRYTLRSPYMRKYHGWEFQGDIPKQYSEYNTSIPGNWLYHIKLSGGKKLSTNDMRIEKRCLEMYNGAFADCSIGKYVMKDVPAFIEEDYMTVKQDYLARIDYELETFRGMDGTVTHYTKTWKDVDKELRSEKDIGRQIKKSVDIEELLSLDVLNETDQLKKAKGIYNYVQTNYTWDESFHIFKDVSIRNIIKDRSGNVGAINILLHNLLRESGIDVKPVFLSTRGHGRATKLYPVLTDFNYLIVQATIDNDTYLLDATDKFLSFGQIPFRCLNQFGRLVDFKNGSTWIDIRPRVQSSTLYSLKLHFDDEENLTGIVNTRTTGYHALGSRKAYFPNPDNYVSELDESNEDIVISDYSLKNSTKTSPQFSETYRINYQAEDISETIYLNPFLFPFFKENPFKLQERTYPIDFGYKDKYVYMLNLDLGDVYEVIEMPKKTRLALPNKAGDLNLSASLIGNKINLIFNLSFNEAVYPPDYYPYLKELMSSVVNTQTNSLIVLKKKS